MTRIVLDIETVGFDFDSLDPGQQEDLLRYAGTDEEVESVKESLGLYPLTGEIVAIGLLNPDSGRGAVYFQAPGLDLPLRQEQEVQYEQGTEVQILSRFWETVARYDEIVTFNGRAFDCPFILVRSAVHRLQPTRNLMPHRYSGPHIDLMDQLTFFGATRRRFSLDMWCRALGVTSPKVEGITGRDVKRLYREGRHLEIARYCARDLVATGELLALWERFIRPPGGTG